MTGQEKVVNFVKEVKEMIDTINEKYGKIMKEVAEIDKEINNLQTTYKDRSEEFIEDQKAILLRRLEKYEKAADDFVKQKQDDLQNLLNDEKKKITERIAKSKISMILALK